MQRPAVGQGDSERKRAFPKVDRFDRDRDGFFGRGAREPSRHIEERARDSRGDTFESDHLERDRGGKSRDASSRDRDCDDRDDRHEDGDRRDRPSSDDRREGDDRRERLFREERDVVLGDRTPAKPRGNPEFTPPVASVEGETASQESMAKLVRIMQTLEIMSVYAQSRLAEKFGVRRACPVDLATWLRKPYATSMVWVSFKQ